MSITLLQLGKWFQGNTFRPLLVCREWMLAIVQHDTGLGKKQLLIMLYALFSTYKMVDICKMKTNVWGIYYLPFLWMALAFEIHPIFSIVTRLSASKDFCKNKERNINQRLNRVHEIEVTVSYLDYQQKFSKKYETVIYAAASGTKVSSQFQVNLWWYLLCSAFVLHSFQN